MVTADFNRKYAIYIAERLEQEEGETPDSWYHTFLLLVDETTQPVQILQQLHYNDDVYGNLLPNLRSGVSDPEKFQNIMAYPLIGGNAATILEGWNAALSYAFYLKHSEIPFGEDYKHGANAVNCRSAVIATLKSIGLDVSAECFAQGAGLQCHDIPVRDVFDFAATGEKTWLEINQRNLDYHLILEASWIPQERYHGPIKYPFLSMKKIVG